MALSPVCHRHRFVDCALLLAEASGASEDAGRRPCQHPPVSARALLGHRGWCPLKVQSISTQMVAGAECGGVCICHQAHRSSWGQVEGECLQGLRFTSQVNLMPSLQSLVQVFQLNNSGASMEKLRSCPSTSHGLLYTASPPRWWSR